MTKPINEYTADELSAKIEAIKAERERTAEKPAFYLSAFNIKPADNWETSLMECGL